MEPGRLPRLEDALPHPRLATMTGISTKRHRKNMAAAPVPFDVRWLRALDVFVGLDSAIVSDIASHIKPAAYPKHSEILAHGNPDRDVYVIGSGSVRVNTVSASGRQVTYRVLGAGDLFGELAALDGRPRSASVFAERDCVLGRIDHRAFSGLVDRYPPLAALMMRRLTQLARALTDTVFEYHAYDVRGRILLELLRLDRQTQGVGARPIVVTGRDMASRVGTTRANVTRILNSLFNEGLAVREGRALRLLDRDALEGMLVDCEFQ